MHVVVDSLILETKLKPDKPLWHLTMINSNSPEGPSRLVFNIHHAVGDGAFILQALTPIATALGATTTTTTTTPSISAPPKSSETINNIDHGALGVCSWLARTAYSAAVLFPDQVRVGLFTNRLPSLRKTQNPNNGNVMVASSVKVLTDGDEMMAIRRSTGATVTEIILSCISGSLKAHMALKSPVLAFMPVRGALHQDSEGNAVSGFFLALPTHESCPLQRLRAVVKQLRPKKQWGLAEFHSLLRHLCLPLIPSLLLEPIIKRCGSLVPCVGVSAFRIPGQELEIATAHLVKFRYFGIFEERLMPLMFSVSSVSNRLTVNLVANDAYCPLATSLVSEIQREVTALYATLRSQQDG